MAWWRHRDDWSGGRVSLPTSRKDRDQPAYAVVEDGVFEAPDDSHVEARLESAGHVRLDAPPESAATDASTTMDGEGVEATSSPDPDDGAWPEKRADVWSYLKEAADVDALGITWQEDSRETMIEKAESAGVTPPEPEEDGDGA